MLAKVALYNTAGPITPPLEERMAPMTDDRRESSFDELAKGLATGTLSGNGGKR